MSDEPGSASATVTSPALPLVHLVLVRHGEAEGNRELRYLGRTDAPLTECGEGQATLLASALPRLLPTDIYASPLLRARATAGATSALLGLPLTVIPELREMDFGAWEGLTRQEVRERDPEALAAWEGGTTPAPPGGESLDAVSARVVSFADSLLASHAGKTVALFSHVTPIKMLVCAALGLPPEGARRMWLNPASITLLDWQPRGEGSRGVLRLFNETAHLRVG